MDKSRDASSHPFHQVLERLIRAPRAAAAPRDAAGQFAFLRRQREAPLRRRPPESARQSAFMEFAGSQEQAPAAPAAPPTGVDAIRRELAIRPDHRVGDLRQIRKRFAAANHPDRNAGPLREIAEQRMKIANSIIDGEIARRAARR